MTGPEIANVLADIWDALDHQADEVLDDIYASVTDIRVAIEEIWADRDRERG